MSDSAVLEADSRSQWTDRYADRWNVRLCEGWDVADMHRTFWAVGIRPITADTCTCAACSPRVASPCHDNGCAWLGVGIHAAGCPNWERDRKSYPVRQILEREGIWQKRKTLQDHIVLWMDALSAVLSLCIFLTGSVLSSGFVLHMIRVWKAARKYWREYGWIEIDEEEEMIGNDPNPDPTPAEWLNERVIPKPDESNGPLGNFNLGHGHVIPRPDGVKARCGGPALCSVCAKELAEKTKPGFYKGESKGPLGTKDEGGNSYMIAEKFLGEDTSEERERTARIKAALLKEIGTPKSRMVVEDTTPVWDVRDELLSLRHDMHKVLVMASATSAVSLILLFVMSLFMVMQ